MPITLLPRSEDRNVESHMTESVALRPEFEWRKHPEHDLLECVPVGSPPLTAENRWDVLLAWLTPRPHYCDRGHWLVHSNLPGTDPADGFPRYYMRFDVAKEETERWLRWRLFKIRSPDPSRAQASLRR